MKTRAFFTLAFFTLSLGLFAQRGITSRNYYDYYSTGGGLEGSRLVTAWLDKAEVAVILEEEMREAGFEWLNTFKIVKIDTMNMVVAICYSAKSNFGFVFESSHKAIPERGDRDLVSLYKSSTGNDYYEKIVLPDGESAFLKIEQLPENLYLIMGNNYWYQYTESENDDDKLVSKEDIIKVLRSDIRRILKGVSR